MRKIIQDQTDKDISEKDQPCPTCGHKRYAYNLWFRSRVCISCNDVTTISPPVWGEILKYHTEV